MNFNTKFTIGSRDDANNSSYITLKIEFDGNIVDLDLNVENIDLSKYTTPYLWELDESSVQMASMSYSDLSFDIADSSIVFLLTGANKIQQTNRPNGQPNIKVQPKPSSPPSGTPYQSVQLVAQVTM